LWAVKWAPLIALGSASHTPNYKQYRKSKALEKHGNDELLRLHMNKHLQWVWTRSAKMNKEKDRHVFQKMC